MTTRAINFKFAEVIVQRLYLVADVLSQIFFQCIMHGFLRGRSHNNIIMLIIILYYNTIVP